MPKNIEKALRECFHPKGGKPNLRNVSANVERAGPHIDKAHSNLRAMNIMFNNDLFDSRTIEQIATDDFDIKLQPSLITLLNDRTKDLIRNGINNDKLSCFHNGLNFPTKNVEKQAEIPQEIKVAQAAP